jgi:glyoxylase-like metal-dependent hydrolase (beta-lactamase superfamily II)
MGDLALEAAKRQISLADREAMGVKAFFERSTSTVSYVVFDIEHRNAAIIDSVLDFDMASGDISFASADAILAYVEEEGLRVDWLLETHAHADHLSAAPYIQDKIGGKIAIGEHIVTVQRHFGKLFNAGTAFQRNGSDFDRLLADADSFAIGSLAVTVLHVPGHTPACITYVIGDAAFVGDTLFMPDYGTARTDFPGGSARQLFRSVRRLMELPGETRLFLCHDYLPAGRDHYAWETTVEAERRDNIHARDGVAEDSFVEMRETRDASLAVPRLILPAIQVNMRAGHMPPVEANGVSYLKIPLTLPPRGIAGN